MTILLSFSGIAFVANAYRSMHYHVAATIKTARIESTRVDALLIKAGLVI